MKALTPTASTSVWNPQSLDVRAFAQAGAVIVQEVKPMQFAWAWHGRW
jgi:hypothetical protein